MTRKQKMKVYHGIPKSITDEHTLFYESCDGKLDNSYTVDIPISFYPNVTGYGVYGTTTDEFHSALTTECKIQTKVFTVDFWATMKTPVNNSYAGRLFEITFNNNSNYKIRLEKDASNNRFHLWENANLVFGEFDFSSANINKPHHFRIIFKVGDYCKMYIDGKEPNMVLYQNKLTTTFEYISHIRLSGANFSVSDFHISNIDRGDYFPNLPQDFIDGKAVIKPRMGQQQIKGDPMYSQVTNLKVPSESSWGLYYNPTASSDGLYTSFDNPELSARGTNTWVSGSKIKIKGLNGEIISGVIDTDTALCRVVSMINATNVIVDSINALAVGDTVKWLNPTNHTVSTAIATITEIDSTTKRISFTGDSVTDGIIGRYVIETTASSSSPTVKTKEGTNVVGTWSGLGTNEAIFTLGANSNITGQDLYVQYALTMPSGNSDFPQLPHTVERAYDETGIEMKPVSEIVIVDDFKGKVRGNLEDCSHTSYAHLGTTLKLPSEITGNYSTGFEEIADYFRLEKLDGNPKVSEAGFLNGIPQQLYKFNIVDIVERKLGCSIPGANKVQWVRDNLDKITLDWCGYGTNHGGNRTTIQNLKGGSWISSAHYYHSTFTQVSINYIDSFDIRIDSDGFFYILVQTEASDGNTKSVVYTDYIAVNVKLKIEKGYEALYCENKRAREDKCNPVLIQKETKTVKRYLPSKECFVTECNYSLPTVKELDLDNANVLIKDDFVYVTTQGTGNVSEIVDSMYKNCIAKLGVNIKSCKYANEILTRFDNYLFNTNFEKITCVSHPVNDFYLYPVNLPQDKNVVVLKPYVVEEEGEVLLGVYIGEYANGVVKAHHFRKYLILNRPLIK